MKILFSALRSAILMVFIFVGGTISAMDGLVYSEPQPIGFRQEQIDAFVDGDPVIGQEKVRVGTLSLTLDLNDEGKALRGRINTLYVQAPYRNKGIASELLNRAIQRMAALGYEEVVWQAHPYSDKPLSQQQLEDFYCKRFPGVKHDGTFFTYVIPKAKKA